VGGSLDRWFSHKLSPKPVKGGFTTLGCPGVHITNPKGAKGCYFTHVSDFTNPFAFHAYLPGCIVREIFLLVGSPNSSWNISHHMELLGGTLGESGCDGIMLNSLYPR